MLSVNGNVWEWQTYHLTLGKKANQFKACSKHVYNAVIYQDFWNFNFKVFLKIYIILY